ncbi:serine hydrolase [Halomonas beimenensis]|uniref:D-alanyl-D-alanine carboxypeptidase n=3 Tax=Halomonas beimenensis TaxID=475662 RepID=A0A291PCD7_9GAMM|nr:serine hydrolase [Halomonas beimenensis]ATJ84550.1 D-alanyl-D-alanine carboxypeptidase [Halomonas beimenensis]
MLPTTTSPWRLGAVIALLAGWLLAGSAQAENPRYAGIVIDADSHEILYAENADAPRYPASLTKMMTLYLVFEALEERSLSLEQPLPVSPTAAAMPATKLYLRPGDRLSVETAIQALIVRSANDVAVVVAEALGGSEAHFARMMTDRARALGMHDTTFRNASGLPDDRQVTTARDMAILARRLMLDFPQYYPYFAKQSFRWRGKTYRGHNRLLANYPGADGLKTGFIRASGFNVATSAVRDGRRMLSVVMGGFTAASRDAHMADLLDRGFVRASLADGHGWLAHTRIADGRLMPASVGPVPSRERMLASLDTVGAAEAPAPTPASRSSTVAAPSPVSTSPPTGTPVRPSATETLVAASASGARGGSAPAADPIREMIAGGDAPGASWGVQVGAFRDAEDARRLADRAAARLAVELAEARIAVPRAEGAGVYRARVVDLHEGQARQACRRLQAQGMECMVVQASL